MKQNHHTTIYTSEYQKIAKEYWQTKSKKQRGLILDHAVASVAKDRKYLIKVFARLQRSPQSDSRRTPRGVIYGNMFKEALLDVWKKSGYICADYLVETINEYIAHLKLHGQFSYTKDIEDLLGQASRMTIHRILSSYTRAKLKKAQIGTHPATKRMLKQVIAVKKRSWDTEGVGCLQLDLVEHNGGIQQGEYLRTLATTDIVSGWSLYYPIKNKSAIEVRNAIDQLIHTYPFPIKEIHTDNGSEFINHVLLAYCQEHTIVHTRSRAYQSNDNAIVESKNWHIVRNYVGYFRYESEGAYKTLIILYALLATYMNYFKPTRKYLVGIKTDGHHQRTYDAPKSPYKRLYPFVDSHTFEMLSSMYEKTDLAKLTTDITQTSLRDCASKRP